MTISRFSLMFFLNFFFFIGLSEAWDNDPYAIDPDMGTVVFTNDSNNPPLPFVTYDNNRGLPYYTNGNYNVYYSQIPNTPSWSQNFNQPWVQTLPIISPDTFSKYQNFIQQPTMDNLKILYTQLEQLKNANVGNVSQEMMEFVEGIVRAGETIRKLSEIKFADSANYDSILNSQQEKNKQVEHIQKIKNKLTDVNEKLLEYSVPFSSPVGEQLYNLQTVYSSQADSKEKLVELSIIDQMIESGDNVKGEQYLRELVVREANPNMAPSEYSKHAKEEFLEGQAYSKNNSLKVISNIYEKHKEEFQKGNFSKITSSEAEALLDTILPSVVAPEVRQAALEVVPKVMQSYVVKTETELAALGLGASSTELKSISDLSENILYSDYTSRLELKNAEFDLRKAQNFLSGNSSFTNSELRKSVLNEAIKLREEGNKALLNGDYSTATSFLNASRYGTTWTLITDNSRTIIGFIPVVGDSADFYELCSGRDAITGEPLSDLQRIFSGIGLVITNRAAIGSVFNHIKEYKNIVESYVVSGTEAYKNSSIFKNSHIPVSIRSAMYERVGDLSLLERESSEFLSLFPKTADTSSSQILGNFENSLQKQFNKNLPDYFNAIGVPEELARSRMNLVVDYLQTLPGVKDNPEKIANYLMGFDFSKPVNIVKVPAGSRFISWHLPGEVNPKFYTLPGMSPSDVGLATEKVIGDGVLMARTPHVYEVTQDTFMLASTAQFANDYWSFKNLPPHIIDTMPPFDDSFSGWYRHYLEKTGAFDFLPGGGPQYVMDSKYTKLVP